MARRDAREVVMRFDGTIVSWNDERGFGFVEPRLGGDAVFVHIKSFRSRTGPRPAIGQVISFEVALGPQGKKRAVAVERIGPSRRASHEGGRSGPYGFVVIAAFLALLLCIAVAWHLPAWVAMLYAGMSLVCGAAYCVDKSAAIHQRARVSEQTLIVLGVLGGWPGAIVAQRLMRHKTSKTSFQRSFRASVVVNVVAFVGLASPWAGPLLRAIR